MRPYDPFTDNQIAKRAPQTIGAPFLLCRDFLSTNFGAIGSTRFPFQDPRQIQFALKLYF